MRLINKDKRSVGFRAQIPLRDPDGTPYSGWSDDILKIEGNVQPGGGKIMAEQYGERLKYIMVMYCEYTPQSKQIFDQFNGQSKGYGACIYAPDDACPDYKVVAVRGWRHIVIELEKVI